MRQKGHLHAVLYTKEQLAELLLPYPNVRLHDFTANLDWIEDYSLYTDYSHYGPKVNDMIVEALTGEDFLIYDVFDVYDANDTLEEIVEAFEAPGQ